MGTLWSISPVQPRVLDWWTRWTGGTEQISGIAPVDFIGAVIVPEVLTHMIAVDLRIDYDEALEILQSKKPCGMAML